MKVLINTEVTSNHRQQIQSVSGEIQIVEPQDEHARLAEISDAEIVFGDFSQSLFKAAERLKWVQVLGAGVDSLLVPEFVQSDVILISAKGFVGPHLADQTWALLLGLLRGVGRAVRERTWETVCLSVMKPGNLLGEPLELWDLVAPALTWLNGRRDLICV